jgi:hypothetical protein
MTFLSSNLINILFNKAIIKVQKSLEVTSNIKSLLKINIIFKEPMSKIYTEEVILKEATFNGFTISPNMKNPNYHLKKNN